MFSNFKSSAKELKRVDNLVICALLMALVVAIGTFTVQIGSELKIGFSFLASDLVYLMFGPVTGAIFGGAADIIGFIAKPTGAYFPGFTLSGILSGLIYGILWYKKPISFPRIFIAKAIVAVLINILLGTYWISILSGKAFMAFFGVRAIKNIVLLPINSILFYALVRVLQKAKLPQLLINQRL